MAALVGATEILPPPANGRRFSAARVVRLGDVDPSGSLRLDSTARYLQDVATDDVVDSGLDQVSGWVVRRSMIVVRQVARLDERVELTTFCTGLGRSWAERTTQLRGAGGAVVDAVSLWVQVAPATGRPTPLSDGFREIYGESSNGRIISPRLVLPSPSEQARVQPWMIRRTDLDPFDHVNNAATWSFLEEALGDSNRSRAGRAELEFVTPVQHGGPAELRVDDTETSGCSAWLVADGIVRSAARWRESL